MILFKRNVLGTDFTDYTDFKKWSGEDFLPLMILFKKKCFRHGFHGLHGFQKMVWRKLFAFLIHFKRDVLGTDFTDYTDFKKWSIENFLPLMFLSFVFNPCNPANPCQHFLL